MAGKVVHFKKEPYDVYIGRPSIWGNPYSHKSGTKAIYKTDTREQAIEAYLGYILSEPDLLDQIPTLIDKTLGCWCSPNPCHGEALLALVSRCQNIGLTDSPYVISFCRECGLPFWINCPRITKTFCSEECIDGFFQQRR